MIQDWTKLSECDVFYDEEKKTYGVVVRTEQEKYNKGILQEESPQAKIKALNFLLKEYDKKFSTLDEYNAFLKKNISISEETGWFLEERPYGKLLLLVTVPGEAFNKLPDSIQQTDIKAPKVTVFSSKTIKKELELIARILEKYNADLIQQQLNLSPPILLKIIASQVREFISSLEGLLLKNSTSLSEEEKIEFGFSDTFEFVYIKTNTKQILKKGWSCFKDKIDRPTANGILFYTGVILHVECTTLANTTATQFIQKYIFTEPSIQVIKNTETVNNSGTLQKEFDNKPYKSEKERLKEEGLLNTATKQTIAKTVAKQTADISDSLFKDIPDVLKKTNTLEEAYKNIFNKTSIGELSQSLISCLTNDLSIDDLFKLNCEESISSCTPAELLSKVDDDLKEEFKDTKDFSLLSPEQKDKLCQALNKTFELPKFSGFKGGSGSGFGGFGGFSWKSKPGKHSFPNFSFPDNLPTDDLFAGAKKAIEKALVTVINTTVTQLAKSVLQGLVDVCKKVQDASYGDLPISSLLNSKQAKDLLNNSGANQDTLNQFLDDVSILLTPSEIIDLLSGKPNKDVVTIIHEVAKVKYPDINKDNIFPFFSGLGTIIFIDDQLNKDLLLVGDLASLPVVDLCSLLELNKEFRKKILDGKIDDKDLDKQLENARKRSVDNIKELSKVAKSGGNNTLSAANDLFQDSIETDPAPLAFANNIVLDTLYQNFLVNLEGELGSYTQKYINVGNGINQVSLSSGTSVEDIKNAIEKVKDLSFDVLPDLKSDISNGNNLTVSSVIDTTVVIITGSPKSITGYEGIIDGNNQKLISSLRIDDTDKATVIDCSVKYSTSAFLPKKEVLFSGSPEKLSANPKTDFKDLLLQRLSLLPANNTNIYPLLLEGLSEQLLRFISQSDLFNSTRFNKLKFVNTDKCNLNDNFITKTEIKNNAENIYKQIVSENKGSTNAFRESNLDEVILLFIQVNCLSVILKDVQTIYQISSKEVISGETLRFISDNIVNSMFSVSNLPLDFEDRFREHFLEMISRRRKKETFIDPYTGKPFKDFSNYDSIIDFIVKEQIHKFTTRLRDFIGSDKIYDNNLEFVFKAIFNKLEHKVPFIEGFSLSDHVEAISNDFNKLTNQERKFGFFTVEKYVRLEQRADISDDNLDLLDKLRTFYEKFFKKDTRNILGVIDVTYWNLILALHKNEAAKDFQLENINLEDFFSAVNYGVRVSYTLPPDLLGESYLNHEKELQRKFYLGKARQQPDQVSVYKEHVVSVPLVYYEEPVFKNNNISVYTQINEPNFDDLTIKLINKITESNPNLFKDIIPINSLISLINIFIINHASSDKRINDAFNNTKSSLVSIFDILSQGDDYTYKQIEDETPVSNPLGFSVPNLSMVGGFPPDLKSMALLAPLLILKALADLVDPTWETIPLTPIGITAYLLGKIQPVSDSGTTVTDTKSVPTATTTNQECEA